MFVEYSEDAEIGNSPVWIVFRDHASHVRAIIVSPQGQRISRVLIGHTEQELRKRVLTERTATWIRRRFPSSTLVTLGVELPIPSPLRSAMRREWGAHYVGAG